MADPLTAALMPEFYYDEEGRPNISIRPKGKTQLPDGTGVTAGQRGLPPIDLGGPEARPAETSAIDAIAAALMGSERASPERSRAVELLTGSTGLGPSKRSPISIMDALGVNPAIELEGRMHEGDVKGAAGVVAPYAAGGAGRGIVSGMSRLSQAIASNPVKALGALGGATMFAGTSEAGPSDIKAIKELQEGLKLEGLYGGPIDGVNSTQTQNALREREKRQAQRRRDELELQRIEAEKGKNSVEAQKAAAALAEQKRLSDAAVRAAEERAAGDKRMKDAEKSVGFFDRTIRDYGPLVGTLLGLGTGIGTKLFVNKSYKSTAETAAARANELINNKGRTLQSKSSALNQFWGEGQKRPIIGETKVPYKSATSDPGFTRNGKAPGASDLYQPSKLSNALVDMGVASGFGAEWQAVEHMLQPDARKEVAEAREAVQKDPSEVNVNRLQAALNRSALTQAIGNWGRGAGIGYLAASTKAHREHVRPNIAKAENERFKLDTQLNQYRKQNGQFAGKPNP